MEMKLKGNRISQSNIAARIDKLLKAGFVFTDDPAGIGTDRYEKGSLVITHFEVESFDYSELKEVLHGGISDGKDTCFSELEKHTTIESSPLALVGGGLRYNAGKAKWSLLDFPSLEPMVRVMEYGATKYAPHNWKKGMPHTEIAECLLRHIYAYLSGEDIDPESGQSHIGHAQCNAMMLQYNIKNHPQLDDRYKSESI